MELYNTTAKTTAAAIRTTEIIKFLTFISVYFYFFIHTKFNFAKLEDLVEIPILFVSFFIRPVQHAARLHSNCHPKTIPLPNDKQNKQTDVDLQYNRNTLTTT